MLAKTTRNATIGFVVLGYALLWARHRRQRRPSFEAAFSRTVSEVRVGFVSGARERPESLHEDPSHGNLANLRVGRFC